MLVRCVRRSYQRRDRSCGAGGGGRCPHPPVVAFGRLEVEPLGCCPIWRESIRRMAQVGNETRKRWTSDELPSRSLQWGSGAQRMIAECRDNGLPAPVWEEIGVRLRLTLRTERVPAAKGRPKRTSRSRSRRSIHACGPESGPRPVRRSEESYLRKASCTAAPGLGAPMLPLPPRWQPQSAFS